MRRLSPDIFYYRTKEETEVDFLLLLPDQTIALFQVCLTLKEPATRRREIDALITTMNELKLNHGMIITLDQEEQIETTAGKIEIVPAWKLFLFLR